jgi:hypothetical protein
MTTDTAPLGGIPSTRTPVATLSLVGGRHRPVKIVEHPSFRGRPRHAHPHPGFPPAILALPVRVVSLNDPVQRHATVVTASRSAGASCSSAEAA